MLELKLNLKEEVIEERPKFFVGLQMKPQPVLGFLKMKEEIAEEIIDDQEARDLGYYENGTETTLAKGFNWELRVDSMNFILTTDSRNRYFTDLSVLLDVLYEHRVKYNLSNNTWDKVAESFNLAQQEIHETCENLTKVLKYVQRKYGV